MGQAVRNRGGIERFLYFALLRLAEAILEMLELEDNLWIRELANVGIDAPVATATVNTLQAGIFIKEGVSTGSPTGLGSVP